MNDARVKMCKFNENTIIRQNSNNNNNNHNNNNHTNVVHSTMYEEQQRKMLLPLKNIALLVLMPFVYFSLGTFLLKQLYRIFLSEFGRLCFLMRFFSQAILCDALNKSCLLPFSSLETVLIPKFENYQNFLNFI